jgi:AcrR family transcriptional regulator
VVGSEREQQKQLRRTRLLSAAAGLFAQRGYHSVSVEDVGAAAGVSGPALYRHFPGKAALLEEILIGASEGLLAGGRAEVAAAVDPQTALQRLITFHTDFALRDRDVIRVQERDYSSLDQDHRTAMRSLQRRYVELWVDVLASLHPGVDAAELRVRAHALFGLINSTPHSVRLGDLERNRVILAELALAVALAPVRKADPPQRRPG